MANLKNWGPLTTKKKQEAITVAFSAIKDSVDTKNIETVKAAVYEELKKTYKLNQKKLETNDAFWANSNYEKHIHYLEYLVSDEIENDHLYSIPHKADGSLKNTAPAISAGGGELTTYVIIAAVIIVLAIICIKLFKNK
ncbi:MAG: hypothetical protein RSA02_04545 [Bacteroidales bacterium]